jgi:general secretion pathway protein H
LASEALDTVVAAETPEGILLELRPAGLSARFCAFLIDWVIRLAILYTASVTALVAGAIGTIIGIFVGVAVLSVGLAGNDRASEQEIHRLESLLALVREEAVMQSRDYGLLVNNRDYRFFYYDYAQQAWLIPAGDRMLGARTLDEPLEFALSVEDREVLLESEYDPEAMEGPEPQIMLLSSGEVTPFTLAVSRGFDSQSYLLTAQFDGTTEVVVED